MTNPHTETAPERKLETEIQQEFRTAVNKANRVIVETPNALGEMDSHVFQAADLAQPLCAVVKSLVWVEVRGLWSAETPFCAYTVSEQLNDRWIWLRSEYPYHATSEDEDGLDFGTEQEVKAAAQADYETRILSAINLEPVEAHVAAALTEAADVVMGQNFEMLNNTRARAILALIPDAPAALDRVRKTEREAVFKEILSLKWEDYHGFDVVDVENIEEIRDGK